jgi:ketosteroid isomerase-like protein
VQKGVGRLAACPAMSSKHGCDELGGQIPETGRGATTTVLTGRAQPSTQAPLATEQLCGGAARRASVFQELCGGAGRASAFQGDAARTRAASAATGDVGARCEAISEPLATTAIAPASAAVARSRRTARLTSSEYCPVATLAPMERGSAGPDDNVETVRRGLVHLRESHEKGHATDGLLAMCSPDIRVDATQRVFNPDVYDGVTGMQRVIREIYDAWEGFNEEHERFMDVGGNRVVVIQTISGRGRVSGASVRQKGALILTVQNGLIHRIEVFADPRVALEAVRLDG